MKNQLNPRASAVLPKRALVPVLIPAVVILCTLALIFWSVWPVLRPTRSLKITQAVHVQSLNSLPDSSPLTAKNTRPMSTRTVQAAGWLEAEPFYIAATALADGVVEEILALEGDYIEKGQVLARLVDENSMLRLASDEAELLRARASLSESHATLAAAELNWEAPYELERAVSSRRASLAERHAELAQLSALIRVEESMLVQAQEELKSIEQAYKGDAAAEIEFITARERADAQLARLEATQAREPILNSAIDRIKSDLRAAERAIDLRIDDRARLDSALASVAHAEALVLLHEAQRDESQLEFDRMTIRAPISGYIQRRLKVPGDKVVRMMDDPYSAHIAHLYDPSKLQVRVDVPLADASEIFTGQQCDVIVEVLADRVFVGEVLRITHEADLQKNTLQVKVHVINPDPMLRPEMLTRVKFLADDVDAGEAARQSTDSTGEIVRVPRDSIDSTSTNQRVWQIINRANGRGELQPVAVITIDTEGTWATVRGELQPGSMIASDPSGCIQGERVRLSLTIGGES